MKILWLGSLALAILLVYQLQPTQAEPITNEPVQEATVDYCTLQVVYCGETVKAIVYSYNSEVGQTDSSPFITASGKRVRIGIVANNCLKFGTEVVIAGKTYTVEDRMNSRYNCATYDIWHESKAESIKWGKKYLEITIK